MLIIENISIHYKSKKEDMPVIENLSLQLQGGEAMVILGHSGCGKSTLINALAGTLTLDKGRIDYVRDNDRQKLNPMQHKIGLIPQNCGLLPWKTVKENCLLPLKIRRDRMDGKRKEDIRKIYEALDITDFLDKYPNELSGGQVQRAAIARAFILNPDVLLMDEPFSALDAITREEASGLFLKVWNQIKPTTILVTHSIDEALYLGNNILVMGEHMGAVKYQMQNPYFGQQYPEDVTYLVTKKLLREQLKQEERVEANA
ncbi:MAG: nitrate/sulfonate/bicarbonate transporter ATP-binding protein [Herbinix sp.]|jgi:NitT/TauT family transport system ATP-binding protein|nr:nitrate/sulfonate/bicarbonate transporter ATP-binding protein [Herbinix sp.]